MSKLLNKLFGTLLQKPWDNEQAAIDNAHEGKTFDLTVQKSAVLIIFGIATVLFSLVFTSYLYTLPPEQDTQYLLRPNLLWINTLILFFVTYYFNKVTGDLEKKDTSKVKKNLLIIGGLTYLFLFGQNSLFELIVLLHLEFLVCHHSLMQGLNLIQSYFLFFHMHRKVHFELNH